MPSFAVVGGGFGGVAALVMLRRAGYHDVTVFEKGARIGGVWNHNRYPGAACDIPSHLYEFSFAPNPGWSRRYAPQAEIQAYLERIVREHGAHERVRTETEVTEARWEEEEGRWQIETSRGPFEADVLICACGQLSIPRVPDIPGRERFEGRAFHSAGWPAGVDVYGRRAAVIGTGASAIQVVPALQPLVEHLDVYQRSPGWTIPRGDFAYSPRAQRLFARLPLLQWLDRQATFLFQELGAAAMTGQRWLLPILRAVGRWNIRRAISDPRLRERVTPTDDPGCKRIMLTDDFFPALTQPNVELVTDAIAEITPRGVRTADGRERAADVLVFATGFHTHAFVAPMEIVGRLGRPLSEVWARVPHAYYGLSVSGFPNLFLIYGPNTNGGTGSVIYTIEAGIRHVISAVQELEARGATRIEVRPEAAEAFDRELRSRLTRTVWHSGCTNWYLDSDGNDPNQWPWTWSAYRRRTARISPAAYELA